MGQEDVPQRHLEKNELEELRQSEHFIDSGASLSAVSDSLGEEVGRHTILKSSSVDAMRGHSGGGCLGEISKY
jgi:hypothetical protein